jgi:glutamine amidotransferase
MIAIIDYQAGNLASVERAVKYLGYPGVVTRDRGLIRNAQRIIFPGVGAAGAAMASLRAAGLDRALVEAFEAGRPILGICLGTQIIMGHSAENDTDCLGLLPGEVEAFEGSPRDEAGRRLKIPQMGWNRVQPVCPHPLLVGIEPQDEFYFVHSYFPRPQAEAHVLATTRYGITFPSVVGYRNLVATQFHLEKSGRPGLRLLTNFLNWQP